MIHSEYNKNTVPNVIYSYTTGYVMADKIVSAAKDDESAVTSTFIQHESFLKRFLKRFLPSPHDIEDVVQDAYLKARCAEQQQEITSPKAFLFRIARNEALKVLGKKSRRITDYIEELDSPEASSSETVVEDINIARQRLGLFCQSALEMTPRCRKVFLMCKVYGFSHKEIALELGISVSGVEKHVARGLVICNDYIERAEQAEHQSPPQSHASERLKYAGANVTPISNNLDVKDLL